MAVDETAAEALFLDVLHGIGVQRALVGEESDLAVFSADGPIRIEIKRLALADMAAVHRELRAYQGAVTTKDDPVVYVLVADRVTAEARSALREAGWGWLDLRGHMRFVAGSLFVDTDVPAVKTSSDSPDPLAGVVGMEVACHMLRDPMRVATVRGLARELGRAPSSVSGVLAGLRQADLIGDSTQPRSQALFWRVADRWRTAGQDLAAVLPAPGRGAENAALRLGLDDVEQSVGWALTDTLAAARYGARLGIRSGYPPDFYVPDLATAHRAVRLLGVSPRRSERTATIRVAPIAMVCRSRIDATVWSDEHWPLAHPLFVALDLAQDPGRGREVLDDWTPPAPWRRVW